MTNGSNNPLYEKMCEKFLINGNRTIGEVLEKKASKYKIQSKTPQKAHTRYSTAVTTSLRAVAVCMVALAVTLAFTFFAKLGKDKGVVLGNMLDNSMSDSVKQDILVIDEHIISDFILTDNHI